MKSFVLNLFLLSVVVCQRSLETKDNSSETTIPVNNVTKITEITTIFPETTTMSIQQICEASNVTCDQCLSRSSKCYFCRKTSKCGVYPYRHIVPRYDECGSMGDIAWLTCIVNFEILIITMAVIGGILIIGLMICCCCCCRKRGRDKWAKQQAKWQKEREERKARTEERKKERQAKTDEIRRKYGLLLDASGLINDNPYQRFDA